jgi:hypothetical protein
MYMKTIYVYVCVLIGFNHLAIFSKVIKNIFTTSFVDSMTVICQLHTYPSNSATEYQFSNIAVL